VSDRRLSRGGGSAAAILRNPSHPTVESSGGGFAFHRIATKTGRLVGSRPVEDNVARNRILVGALAGALLFDYASEPVRLQNVKAQVKT
jgi:hypothetical protein